MMKSLLLLSLLFLSAPVFSADADAPVAKRYRIMCVGDSITEGSSGFSVYRVPLLEKLTAAGYAVEYVGTRKSELPHGPLFHEGYSGHNAEFLAKTVPGNFKLHPADIVLIHTGHNHTVEEKPVAKIIEATEKMITAFRETNPQVIIFLAQVIPSGKLPKYEYIPELNEAIPKLAQKLDTPAQRVICVNQADGFDFTTDTIGDKVHPNAQGAEKMASRWFDALVRILDKPAAK